MLELGLPISLVYHNITPVKFLASADPAAAEHARRGLEALSALGRITTLGVGDSEFNRLALVDAGFGETGVLPYCVRLDRLAAPNPAALAEIRAKPFQILMTGRVVPNKCQHEGIAVLAHLQQWIPGANISFVGAHDSSGPYCRWIEYIAEDLGVGHLMRFHGQVSDADLAANFCGSSALLVLSEHEGFCVPVVEAMHFGLPVVGFDSTAVPDTMGGAGVLLKRKEPRTIAAVLAEIARNEGFRDRLIERGKIRAADFAPAMLDPQVAEVVRRARKVGR